MAYLKSVYRTWYILCIGTIKVADKLVKSCEINVPKKIVFFFKIKPDVSFCVWS